MKRIHHYLSDRQIAALQQLAKETGLSVAELIRRAVDLYLGREARKGKGG